MTWSSTSLSASSCMVQTVRLSGGAVQASATSRASAFASSFGAAPGRGASYSARARRSPGGASAKRRRTRSTVVRLTCSAAAVAQSYVSSLARSRMCARVSVRAGAFPRRISTNSSDRSSSVSSTRCSFVRMRPPAGAPRLTRISGAITVARH